MINIRVSLTSFITTQKSQILHKRLKASPPVPFFHDHAWGINATAPTHLLRKNHASLLVFPSSSQTTTFPTYVD